MGFVLAALGALFPLALALLVIAVVVWPVVVEEIERIEDCLAD